MDFAFANKAQTLAQLSARLRTGQVLDQTTVRLGAWRDRPDACIAAVQTLAWGRDPLIVRSSASMEDHASQSMAGQFLSIQSVVGAEPLARAIDDVFVSYGADAADDECVLIQPMLDGVVMSGVALSCELGSGRPYIVVNYGTGADTTAVTGGQTNELEVYYHYRGAVDTPNGRLGAVIRLLREVELVTDCDRVDMEFAFCEGELLPHLLQARPIVKTGQEWVKPDEHHRLLHRAHKKVAKVLSPHPLSRGRRSALGVMPDWNPAEIIGVRPRPLALSLYRELVTDVVWARQRCDYGYKDVRGFPLIVDLLGLPYIDIRASFNSFVPDAIDEGVATRLVDYYMDRLVAAPALHDKVEFDIVFSCYSFDLDARLAVLGDHGFSAAERDRLRQALFDLTARVLDPHDGPWVCDRAMLDILRQRRDQLAHGDLDPLSRVYWLLEDCRRYGTRPFAGLARVGFIAVQMLNSLVATGAIEEADHRAFMMGLNTVSAQMQRDFAQLDRHAFLARYGHLRPGAYDILSARYDETPDAYFGGWHGPQPLAEAEHGHGASAAGRARLEWAVAALLRDHGFDIDAQAFLDFLGTAIREREAAKFEFTRNLSDALAQLTAWGRTVELSAADLSYADIGVVRHSHCSAEDPLDLFVESIVAGRQRHRVTAQTALPPLITDADQVWGFHLPASTPTFVTLNAACGPVVTDLKNGSLAGGIVMLPNADPGYDWIFTRGVAGFITAYGGANSHMAIRASELDMPAVIGAGERLFRKWVDAPALRIDCATRLVKILPHGRAHADHRRIAAG